MVGSTSPITFDCVVNKIINFYQFSRETVMRCIFLHCCLLRKVYSNYYFINKVVVYNWRRQTLHMTLSLSQFRQFIIHLFTIHYTLFHCYFSVAQASSGPFCLLFLTSVIDDIKIKNSIKNQLYFLCN